MNNNLTWKKSVMTYYTDVSPPLPAGTEKTINRFLTACLEVDIPN